ncbi:MBL fold metallo-hydrolase [Neptuniibacter halophilus]|uniref:MBL fold metallo-hydrolase n=1 Tax=Neptuniibacter halophilus TaxID=651666 RepID=UPI002572EB8B|nr:MBL fold metallo-hydrolase [Neptuniibacter halophilus]
MSAGLLSSCGFGEQRPEGDGQGAAYVDGRFKNTEIDYQTTLSGIYDIARSYLRAERKAPVPQVELPMLPLQVEQLEQLVGPAVIRLGHSSVLIRLDEHFYLTDPVFSERASPVGFAGPQRFHEPPIATEQLPPLKAVIISHDHYDHLDKQTLQALAKRTEFFVTPLKVGEKLMSWGVDKAQIIERDWWRSVRLDSVTMTATPAQHFSGRGLFDRDKTLWASWVIQGQQANIFFSGDSGYFAGFKEIGERYGPFDITLIETGAYNELWSEIHMLPEQSVQAHIDLQGRAMIPIHNSTFDLALHDWYEPLERASVHAEKTGVTLLTPLMGEIVSVQQPAATSAWWRDFIAEPEEQLVMQLP